MTPGGDSRRATLILTGRGDLNLRTIEAYLLGTPFMNKEKREMVLDLIWTFWLLESTDLFGCWLH